MGSFPSQRRKQKRLSQVVAHKLSHISPRVPGLRAVFFLLSVASSICRNASADSVLEDGSHCHVLRAASQAAGRKEGVDGWQVLVPESQTATALCCTGRLKAALSRRYSHALGVAMFISWCLDVLVLYLRPSIH